MQDLLTVPEFCDLLRISPATAYTWISRRKIPVLKLGRSVRIRRANALKLLREIPACNPLNATMPPAGENGGAA